MRTSDFDYPLPPERIAQTPAEPRDSSRLLVLRRNDPGEDGNPKIEHRNFRHLLEYLRAGDLTVFNRSRVIPARLRGVEAKSGAPAEVMLVRRLGPHLWEALVRPGRRLRSGAEVLVGPVGGPAGSSEATVQIIGAGENGLRTVRLSDDVSLDQLGEMPLPPYINEKLTDAERYQTVYGNVPGSVAAPTAGLHFTDDLLAEIRGIGVKTAWVTLHVGLDTFRPVQGDDPTEHRIHTEYYEVSAEAAGQITRARREGRRIIAVGTTSVRTLEQLGRDWQCSGPTEVQPTAGQADIFILPGHRFRLVDAMITNFHLPRSTLLMLVSAFAGRELVLSTYREAIAREYRFFSFGDAMFIH
jgi:S-adenosylmethionine:tRNA ribosyltransferase-isomerase